MVISHSKKFIFIHNYKVAGTSIQHALDCFNNNNSIDVNFYKRLKTFLGIPPSFYSKTFPGHIKANELRTRIPSKIFNSYYKFGFVRNPWDWQVSLYTFMLMEKNHHQHELIKSFKNFDEYIDWRVHNDLRLQKSFFYSDDEFLMDFVGKFESLNADFQKICDHLSIKSDLPYLNSSRKEKEFLHFYSKASLEMIDQAFREDISLFGYSKPKL
ncbi:sulfotransferase family protein [Salegentibacter sp. LM13S]|uniref:sulfotransferase family 2 domain-containing protein n=1 Tax=Salegentibacter lacus TaxID=2873599 RepID=UPI001CCD65AB|nr:sulfotransferase family 2 domain-containing protein [Salegentibacter lacus]MBZ9632350.1 sulfotransferase family protein [Salegentibacter lacus]